MKPEAKVGLLFIISIVGIILFAYFLGVLNPFSNTKSLNVMYNFAGGIEEGSPVRVMGIKVGKVRKIEFTPEFKASNGEEVKLKVIIDIEKRAWTSIRKDSKYFINLAGVIGEKFLEVSPGSLDSAELQPGDYVRGEDPPRIDQLISQSYGLAGKVIQILEKNEGKVTDVITQIDHLVTNVNKTLLLFEKTSKNKDFAKLLDNSMKLTEDLAYLSGQLRSKKAEDTYTLIHKLLFRLENLDGPAIKKFFQEEGIKAKLF